MSITSAELYTEANSRTGRTGDHDTKLKAVLQELAHRGLALLGETTQALTSGDRDYTVPTNCKRVRLITLVDSNSVEGAPLTEISWHEYKERLAGNAGNGAPGVFVVQNGTIYLDPPPNATTYPNMKITTELYHADSLTVSWPDRYEETLTEGLCWKIYLGLDQGAGLGIIHKKEYLDGVDLLLEVQGSERNGRMAYTDA